jgi:biotin synthase
VAGANSVFLGDRLLTTPNPDATHDERLLGRLGMHLTEPTSATSPAPANVGG